MQRGLSLNRKVSASGNPDKRWDAESGLKSRKWAAMMDSTKSIIVDLELLLK
jgi:hypothetical protein